MPVESHSYETATMDSVRDVLRQVEQTPDQPVHVWRIDQLKLSPIPPASVGTFYTGDSYVILHVLKTPEGTEKRVYFWQGTSSSEDETGASAILAQQIDDAMGGSAEQIRVIQGQESEEFKRLFSGGLNFRAGGVASGFKSAAAGNQAVPTKLFVIKCPAPGKPPQVTEVHVSVASLVSNASYVMDNDGANTLTVWHGAEAGLKEKRCALETANTFRSSRGTCRLTVIDQEDVDSDDALAFFTALGAHNPADVVSHLATCEGPAPAGTAVGGGGGISTGNGSATAAAAMYAVHPEGVSAPGRVPPTRSALVSTTQQLLVAQGRAWLWVGSKSGQPLTQVAQHALQRLGLPGGTEVEVVKDRLEPGLFKTHIPDWSKAEYEYEAQQAKQGPGTAPASPRPAAVATDWEALARQMVAGRQAALAEDVERVPLPAEPTTVGPDSKLTISVVVENELTPLSQAEYGHFFDAESYVVLYEYKLPTGEDRQVIYFWQGRHATNLEQGTAAVLATDMHNTRFKDTSALVRVVPGAEPVHLVALFRGGMVVHRGTRPANGLPHGGAGLPGPRLYQVKCEGRQAAHAIEVELSAASLYLRDSFLLKEEDGRVCVWCGSGCSDAESALARHAAGRLAAGGHITLVQEGSEPDSFWAVLGDREAYDAQLQAARHQPPVTAPPVLFKLRDAGDRAALGVDVQAVFSQDDLDTLGVAVLEAGSQMFVWCGREASRNEVVRAHQAISAYGKALGKQLCVIDVAEGAEPPFMTQHFAGWDASKRADIADAMEQKMRLQQQSWQ